jgi:hypothetical protein
MSAGAVGEILTSQVLVANAVALTNNTLANVASILLTAGDWDVSGNVCFHAGNSTTYTAFHAAINTASATLPIPPAEGGRAQFYTSTPLSHSASIETVMIQPTGPRRISVSAPTTVYLVAQSQFATSTMSAYGYLRARRVR